MRQTAQKLTWSALLGVLLALLAAGCNQAADPNDKLLSVPDAPEPPDPPEPPEPLERFRPSELHAATITIETTSPIQRFMPRSESISRANCKPPISGSGRVSSCATSPLTPTRGERRGR